MKITDYASYFNIPRFLFLRKCAAIREQLQLMGYPNSKLQIRNIPVGSKNYYLCYPEQCYALGYQVKKNEAGDVMEVVNLSFLRVKEEVREYQELPEDNEWHFLLFKEAYPIAEPSSLEVHVFEDEKIKFKPTTLYRTNAESANAAVEELENNSKQIFITKSEISAWLKKHRNFYWTLQDYWNVLAFRPFQLLYATFQYLSNDFENMKKAQQAVDEYRPIDEDWLYKYDRLYYCATSSLRDSYQVFHEAPFILQQHGSQLYLVGEEFKGLYEFPKLFRSEEDRERGKN